MSLQLPSPPSSTSSGSRSQILENRSISSEDREVVYRTLPGQTASEFDITYVVRAVWRGDEDAQGWYSAAEEIRALFITHSATRPVKIELLSWELETQCKIAIVEAEHPLVPAWTATINPRLHQIINKSPKLKDGWKTIDVIRIGFSSEEYQPISGWLFTQTGKWAGTGFGGPVKAGVTTQAIGYVTDAQAILDWLRSIGFEARLATL
ncbi:MAG: hypothetical protein Q9185_003235 [Variospora sp. 1 TL-2023]